MKCIMGLIGAPNSGKDVVANFLVKEKGFKKIAFADKIKEEYYKTADYDENIFKSSRGTKLEKQIRDDLWKYSKEKLSTDKYYFIRPIIEQIEMCSAPIVVSDIRTELELETLKFANIILILRNYKKELEGDRIPDTKIKTKDALGYPIFWNNIIDLQKTHERLDFFCNCLLKGYFKI